MAQRALCSEDLELVVSDAEVGHAGALAREHSVKGLIHDGRAADPDPADVGRGVLADLLADEGLVPALWVDVLLGKTHVQAEVVDIVPAAVGLHRFE